MIIALHVFTVSLSLALLLLAIYKREAKRSLNLAYAMLAVFVFSLGYFFEVTAQTMEVAILGKQLKYLGLPFVSPFIFLFLLDVYGIGKPGFYKRAALFLVPVLHCLVAVTFPLNGIFYSRVVWVTDAAAPYLLTSGSLFYYIGFLYSYLITMISIIFSIYQSRKTTSIARKQSAVIITAVFIPGIGNALNVLLSFDLPFDPTSILMSIGCALLAYSLLRLKLFQVAPIAREQIIESMKDAFILIDRKGFFIDANAAAIKLLPQLAVIKTGAAMENIEGFPWTDEQLGHANWSVDIQNDTGELRHYSISKTVVSHQNDIIAKNAGRNTARMYVAEALESPA